MKIDLKLNNAAIMLIASQLEVYANLTTADFVKLDIKHKSNASISIETADIFAKKKAQIERTNDLFESKKNHKIKLKYHQAETLFYALNAALIVEENDFNKSVITQANDQLHQKL